MSDFYERFYSPSDLTTYGAEDYEELHSILDALDRAQDQPRASSSGWKRVSRAPRHRVSNLRADSIPTSPGVYVWFRKDEEFYVGMAGGRRGLRGRLRAHLATTPDLSRSTLRASVAVEQLHISRAVARARPTQVTAEQVRIVDEWLKACEIAWVECADTGAAQKLELELRRERMPRLNRL